MPSVVLRLVTTLIVALPIAFVVGEFVHRRRDSAADERHGGFRIE